MRDSLVLLGAQLYIYTLIIFSNEKRKYKLWNTEWADFNLLGDSSTFFPCSMTGTRGYKNPVHPTTVISCLY